MKAILSVLITAFFCSGIAMANEEYVCNFGDVKRLISISYENEGQPVPCEVWYDKGQGVERLWNAQAEVGYCESKASEFVSKQESWGWTCKKVAQAEYVEEVQSIQEEDVQAALDQ